MNYDTYRAHRSGLFYSYKFWLSTILLIVLYSGILFGQTTIYIDPTASDGGDGTLTNPYNEWADVHPLESNTNYLQKKGTTALLTNVSGVSGSSEYGIGLIGCENTYIGAYGTGADPIVQTNDWEPQQHVYGNGSLISAKIEGIHFTSYDDWNDFYCHVRIAHTGSASGKLELKGCEFTHGDYAAIYPGGQLDSLIIEDCVIHEVGQEGIWGGVKNAIIRNNHLYDINMKYWWVGKDETSAGGDAIQMGPGDQVDGGHLLIENNIIDRSSTGNKFCIISSAWTTQPNYQGINFKITLRYNTIYSPIEPYTNSYGGGALYVEGVDEFIAYGNHFSGRGYDTDYGRPTFLGYVMANEGDYFYYNVFDSVGQLALREDDAWAAGYQTNQHSEFKNNIFIGTPSNFAYCVFFEEEAGFTRTVEMANNMFAHPSGLAFGSYANEGGFDINTNNLFSVGSSSNWNSDLGITDWENGNFTIVQNGAAHDAGDDYANPTISGTLYDRDIDSALVPLDIRDIGVLEYQDGVSGGNGAIYVNPANGGDPAQDGTIDHPFDQWSDLIFEDNKTYLQKRGTTTTLTESITLDDVQNVTLGAYGDGADPVIKGDGLTSGFRIDEGCGGIVIENFNINGDTDYSGAFERAIYIDGDLTGGDWVESVTIRNCTIAYQNNALIVQPWSTGLDTLLVENCIVHDIKGDGLWGAVTNPTVRGCHLYNINMDWHYVGHTLEQSGGDALELRPGGNAMDIGGTMVVENNIIDRRETGNKFCLIYSDPLSEPGSRDGIFKVYINNNTFYAPKDTTDDGGGAAMYIIDADSLFIHGNTFSGKGYDVGSESQDLAWVDYSYVDARYNLFESVNYFEILNSIDNDKCFYNNIFVNIPGDGIPVVKTHNKPPIVRNNIFAANEGASIIDVFEASGPLNDTSHNIVVIGDVENWDSRIGFTDWENENYTLATGSQAIDNGFDYAGWNYDIDSIPTPQGFARDIGACEYPDNGQSNLPPVIEDQTFSVDENSPTSQVVATVEAMDPDNGQSLTFSIESGNTGSAFMINSSSGELSVATGSALNFEQIPVFSLVVKVQDNGPGNLTDQATITINLNDVNEAPVINDQSFDILQTIGNGELVGVVEANDPDDGQSLTFSITAGNTDDAFQIDAGSGELTVADNSVLNINTTPVYSLTITVQDNGAGGLTDDGIITVTLEEVNLAPNIDDQEFSADENLGAGDEIGIVAATDPNSGQTITFSILSGNTDGAFEIGSETGRLAVVNEEAINYEVNPQFNLIIQVEDDGNGNLTDEANITVNLYDINEPPVMDDQNFVVEESIANGELVGFVEADDPDQGQLLTFSITGGNSNGAFAINASTGELTVADNSVLDFSVTPIYFLDVEVKDDGLGELTDEAVIAVSDDEVNQAPVIEDQNFSLAENTPSATLVGSVVAMDPDAGQSLTYSIISGNAFNAFQIDEMSGDLSVDNAAAINFEENQNFTLVVKVVDDGIGNLSDEATVNVVVVDVNEAPVVESATFNLQENSMYGTIVGEVVAEDPDNGQSLSFSIISGNIDGAFSVDEIDGTLFINNNDAINYEANPVFYLVIEVQDDGLGNLSGQGVVTINLEDINEVPEIEDQYFNVEENSVAGTVVGEVVAMDPDNGQTLTYSITSGNTQDAFFINPSSGLITVMNQSALDISVNPIFILEVEVEDNGSGNLSDQASVVVALMGSTSIGESTAPDFEGTMYPNPAREYVNLGAKNIESNEVNLKIIDFMGQVVFDKDYLGIGNQFETKINLEGFSEGLYIVYLSNGEQLEKMKLIKQ